MKAPKRRSIPALIIALLLGSCLIVSCSTVDREQIPLPAPTIIPVTRDAVSSTPTNQVPTATPSKQPAETPQATTTTVQLFTPTEAPVPSATAVATNAPTLIEEEIYRVAFVSTDDVLNVRSGPGIENEILASLAPTTTSVRITGTGQPVSGSTWVPIIADETEGWVNSQYLSGQIPSTLFCQDPDVTVLLTQLKKAIANEDSALLSQLVHPERGLRLRTSWWNPEIRVSNNDLNNLFGSTSTYDWGIEDGSGLPIEGSIQEVLLPLLQKDLLLSGSISCNQIDHGPTAGSVQLPDGYQGINYMAFFRAADDSLGFDWGTWVVGIEEWQSRYYLSFLIHYSYEI